MAPEAGLEPATLRLTAACSTIELLWNSKARRLTEQRGRVNLFPILAGRPGKSRCCARPERFFEWARHIVRTVPRPDCKPAGVLHSFRHWVRCRNKTNRHPHPAPRNPTAPCCRIRWPRRALREWLPPTHRIARPKGDAPFSAGKFARERAPRWRRCFPHRRARIDRVIWA